MAADPPEVHLFSTITGVEWRAAQCLIGEIGVGMSRFVSPARLVPFSIKGSGFSS
jgi:hypothetical protein